MEILAPIWQICSKIPSQLLGVVPPPSSPQLCPYVGQASLPASSMSSALVGGHQRSSEFGIASRSGRQISKWIRTNWQRSRNDDWAAAQGKAAHLGLLRRRQEKGGGLRLRCPKLYRGVPFSLSYNTRTRQRPLQLSGPDKISRRVVDLRNSLPPDVVKLH